MRLVKYLLPKRFRTIMGDKDSSDLEKECIDADVTIFLNHVADSVVSYDNIDAYSKNPMKPFLDTANVFLEKYSKTTYDGFVRNTDLESLKGGDFDCLLRNNLKRRLFEYRARIFFHALDSCEKEGINIIGLLSKLKEVNIPNIKKTNNEPTYNRIVESVSKN